MKRLVCILVCLVALMPRAGAVTVLTKPDDTAARLDRARAQARDMAPGHYGMIPITDVPDGVYDVAVRSTSPYFRIVEAALTVADGAMVADIVIASESYDRVRVGEEIPGTVADGKTTFRIPVPGLNVAFDCAAHSVSRDRWYDRRLLVEADSLPEGVLGYDLPDYELIGRALEAYSLGNEPAERPVEAVEAVAVNYPDGDYAIEVALTGGSGRASVSSPTRMVVRDGRAYARLLWSSAYYDYMLLGGVRYDNLSSDGGNSTFEIPIPAMDAPVDVVADTTAMGDPVEIQYQLTFYADTVGDVRQVPQEAAKYVLLISLFIIVAGGILNYFVKKGRR